MTSSLSRKVVVYELLSLDGVAEAPDQFFAIEPFTTVINGVTMTRR